MVLKIGRKVTQKNANTQGITQKNFKNINGGRQNSTFVNIISRLSIVKTSFSLLSLLENFVVTFLFATFAHMKPAQIFNQYIWIINTLRAYRKLTLEQLNQKWQDDGVADGNPLQRSSFNRHRDAILDMFGIIIDCEPKTYKYYISNPEVLNDGSISQWLFSTLTVHGVLSDCAAIKDRIILENVPAGEEYLDTIKRAIKSNHRLHLGYKKFGAEGYVSVAYTSIVSRIRYILNLVAS